METVGPQTVGPQTVGPQTVGSQTPNLIGHKNVTVFKGAFTEKRHCLQRSLPSKVTPFKGPCTRKKPPMILLIPIV